MILEILICSFNNDIFDIKLPEQQENVKYLISWQYTDLKYLQRNPKIANRNDVRIIPLAGKGLSKNRNNALRHANGDVCLISDSDVLFYPECFDKILSTFTKYPELDIATFQFDSVGIQKTYPPQATELPCTTKNYYISSIEIAFRRTSVQNKIQFNELFGLGAPVLQSGEEEVFILDALNTQLKGYFFPISICRHDELSTGEKATQSPGFLMSKGAYFYKRFKLMCIPRLIWQAAKNRKEIGFIHFLKWTLKGMLYIIKETKLDKS